MEIGAYRIRRATPDDAAGIAAVLGEVAAERLYSAILSPWPVEEQRAYLASLSEREAFHVAETGTEIIGYQSLDLYSSVLPAMSHVATMGTFVSPRARGHGVGKALWTANKAFAESAGYRKIAILVRATNASAQAFYRSVGFVECGRLREQVCVDGVFDDEILLEHFLS